MIKIDALSMIRAVCPFCKKYINVKGNVLKNINVTKNRKLLTRILSKNINHLTCTECGESFYYEHSCGVINADKNYAVASLPTMATPLPAEKTALFNILGKNDFRLRYVHEFIYLTEKVRIFEFDLDDRVLEVIKYNYIANPMNLGTDAKIILTGVDGNALIFTVYDDYDKPLSTHRTGIDAYTNLSKCFEKEIIEAPYMSWSKIDLRWAQRYTKENIKND